MGRNAAVRSLTELQQMAATDTEVAEVLNATNAVAGAADAPPAAKQSPWQNGLYAELAGTTLAEATGVRFFVNKTSGTPEYKVSYSLLLNLYADDKRTVFLGREALYCSMLLKSDEQRLDVLTGAVVPYAAGSLNLDPRFKAAKTLLDSFNAIVAYSAGSLLKVVSTRYTGITRNGSQGNLHAISFVRL